MTVTEDPQVDTGDVAPITSGGLAADDVARLAPDAGGTPDGAGEHGDDRNALPPLALQVRPVLAAGLSTAAAGIVIGGIFGSWAARGFGVFAAALGAGWALYVARAERRATAQALFPLVLLFVGAVVLIPAPGGPGELPTLVGDAIDAGRRIRPPVPFDPGWRVLIIAVIATIGFAAAWVGLSFGRPKLAVAVPLPVIGLASVTQPDSEQFVAGAGALLFVLAALGVLFGTDQPEALDREFETRRLVRGLLAGVPIVAVLVVFNRADFLFPTPVFDPDDQPQKPRAAPLAAAEDRVLFEVGGGSAFTGPWRIGALDVYEDDNWLIPGFDRDRLVDIEADGSISPIRAGATQEQIEITVRDLGDSAVLPTLPGATQVTSEATLVFDPRMVTLRVPSGRVPAGLAYTFQAPSFPSDDQLAAVEDPTGSTDLGAQSAAPSPPPEIQLLLDAAPPNPWRRLDAVRQELLDVVTASGAGAPVAVAPERVVDLLQGSQTGTPFEIVAAEALLARWAGIPSRVGFGFDGLNLEDGIETVRPRNAAQWLEVWFDGFGWVPLIGTPAMAEATLDTDPNARFNPTIEPSTDVAVEIYLPFELEDLTLLYQRIRDAILNALPAVVIGAVVLVGWPIPAKARRRAVRRRWAAERSPRHQVAVEYAEFRDAAIDLGVGDVYDTPLEYLFKVRDDREHTELAWLASRSIFGDMAETATDEDVLAAEGLSTSLRRRLATAQPLQIRFLALVSRASLAQPYTEEIPNVAHLRIPGAGHLRRLASRLRLVAPRRRSTTRRLVGDPR